MKRKETKIKMSFEGVEPIFYVNKSKKTVACKIRGNAYETMIDPWFGELSTPSFESVGIAYCSDNDKFDEERGKRIALAKAENKLYCKCVDFYTKKINEFSESIAKMDEFKIRANKFCRHNDEYIENISEVDSPNYKKEVNPVKRGETFYTKR